MEKKSSETESKVDFDIIKSAFKGNTSEIVELTDLIGNSVADLFTVLFSSDPSVYENNEDLLPHFKKKGKKRRL